MGLLTTALVNAVIGRVVTVASPHIEDYFKRWKGAEKELRQLKLFLPQIQSVVNAAEGGELQISGPLREWLQQLKDALYEADDVLDELDYRQLKQQAEEDAANEIDSLMSSFLIGFFIAPIIVVGLAAHIFTPDAMLDKLRRAVKKLGKVAAGVGPFVQLVTNSRWEFQQREAQTTRKRETGPSLTENKVFGREEERDGLLRWLTGHEEEESGMNVSLFSVVGHGGMGKTTLAQLVFNEKIVQDSFDLKIWVCVSTSFDVRGLISSIIESATKQRPEVDGLPALQDTLKKMLETSGKFLLVLDDVWNDDNSSNWDKLLAPLKCGHEGSKILLTTRMDQVAGMAARAMGASAKGSLKLGGLRGEDYSSLFNRYAFAGVDYGNYPNLQFIGMEIAKRLGSSPLVAKTVGGLLNSNLDDGYWTKILHSKNISDRIQHGEDNIMSILMLSYHHLPLHLRSCFAYCGMFPQDHLFDKHDLVLMWMAVGLIQHSHENQGDELEDIGAYYFDELSRRSLFSALSDGYLYVMHDLLHDLARSVSHGECSSFVDDDKKVQDAIPNTVRHLYMEIHGNLDILQKMDNLHNLYSLVLKIENARLDYFLAIEKLLRSLKSIRLLHVVVFSTRVAMPDVFSHLIHLRSLKFGLGYLWEFPRSVCKLYHLQVLNLPYLEGVFEFPEDVNKLVKLRRLPASDEVAGVGKLISLRELNFRVRKESGYKIGELGDLICLWTLTVDGLENVENEKEARAAKLWNKNVLQILHLTWSINSDLGIDKHELVLHHLQPHANLKELMIIGYRGIRYPNWMGFESINNLRHIRLFDCSRLDHLPPLERLPYLKKFELSDMPAIKKIDFQCPRLEMLKLSGMPAIKKIDFQCPRLEMLGIYGMDGLEELSGPSGQWHHHLDTLTIRNCSKLEVLPSLSMSIREIDLNNLGLVALPTLWLDCSNTCSTSDSSSSSLRVLEIQNCGKITSLGKGLLQQQHYLTALEHLNIRECEELVDFPSGGLQHLRALKKLEIARCPKLRVVPDGNDDKFLPWSLQSLSIQRCADLMPTILLKGIDSLRDLTLSGCREPMSLEGFMGLRNVEHLDIAGWPNLANAAGSDFTLAVGDLMIRDPLPLLVFLRNITSVRDLTMQTCGQLDGELEQWLLKNQTTLKSIKILKARALRSLPGWLKDLSSLESLTIKCASKTLIERCKKDEGADWPTISHIPKFEVTD